jgi:TolA-binding protein
MNRNHLSQILRFQSGWPYIALMKNAATRCSAVSVASVISLLSPRSFISSISSISSISLFSLFSLFSFALTGCSTMKWFGSDKQNSQEIAQSSESDIAPPDAEPAAKAKAKTVRSGLGDVELKQAQLTNRLIELEDEVRVQKEKIRLLEQGLLTGIAPSELTKPPLPKVKKSKQGKFKAATESRAGDEMDSHGQIDGEGLDKGLPPVAGLPEVIKQEQEDGTPASPQSYKVRIQVVKDYIQASRHGMAVADLSQILKEFGPKAGDGEAKFLLGRAYLGLKEYSIARGELEAFLKEFPKSSYEPMVRLDLAKSYAGLNLRDRSRSEYAKIPKMFPGSEEADIAVNEVERMKGSL